MPAPFPYDSPVLVSDTVTIRSPRIYGMVVGLTLLAITCGLWGGVSVGSVAVVLLVAAVVVTGMPHGAIDHLVAMELYGLDFTWTDQAKFYGGYLALMALYGAFWVVTPVWSLMVFLVMTMYHFGQADLAYWDLPPLGARLLYLSRGLFVIGIPIAAFPTQVDPIFAAIAGVRPSTWPLLVSQSTVVCAGLVLQHGFALGLASLGADVGVWDRGREALNIVVLGALFGFVHPLVAFSVYFGLWHSLGHILELLRFFEQRDGTPAAIPAFYRRAALFTVLPFVGLGVLYWATHAFGSTEQMIALLFIAIAVLTLPHMIIVERMYQKREGEGGNKKTRPSLNATNGDG